MICILGGGFIALSLAEYMGERAFIVRSSHLDLTNNNLVKTFFKKNEQITAVILCATVGGSRLEPDPEDTVERNLRIFTNVQSNLNGRKMIWFSSGAAFMENSRYGYSKLIQERLSDNATCIRIYNCFGKKELPSRFIATCIREKSVIIPDDRYFDFFYIEHLYKVIDSVLDGTIKNNIFDVVYMKKYKLSEIARMLGAHATVTGTSPNNYIGDGKTIELFNFGDISDILKVYVNNT